MTSIVIPFVRRSQTSQQHQLTAEQTDFAAMYAGFFAVAVRADLISVKELEGIAVGAKAIIDLMRSEAAR